MMDIKLTETSGIYEFSYGADGDFVMEDGFDTQILMSFFCQKRANESEIAEPIYRGGWVGNKYYNEDGYENGSKIWVHTNQGRITNTSINDTVDAGQKGLNWLVDDELLNDIEVTATTESGTILLDAKLTYTDSRVEHKYYDVWRLTGD
jgi:phage gp46-like protein